MKLKSLYQTITVFIFFLSLTIINAQEKDKNYAEAFQLIEVWLEAQKDYENIPGMASIIVNDQDILWSSSFGKSNIEANEDMRTNTICSICSITKSFTAIAIMKLVDEGKINLDDKVKNILPFFQINQKFPDSGDITIASLLSHSSGLPGNTEHSYFTPPDFQFPSKQEFRAIFDIIETKSTVGSDVIYSNIGYALLGEIIERISGNSYEDYILNEILKPLNMDTSYLNDNNINDVENRATGYSAVNRDMKRQKVNLFHTKSMKPAMGLWTTVFDIAKFMSWQFRLREAKEKEILSSQTIKLMHTKHTKSKDGYLNWGLGFEVIEDFNGDVWVSHGGTCPGFVSLMQLNLTKKIGFAIMINGNKNSTFKFLNGMKHILSKTIVSDSNREFTINLKDYTGFYNMNPWNSEVYIMPWGKDLVMLQLPENSLEYGMRFYKHGKEDTFCQIDENGNTTDIITFERNKDGLVFRFKNGGNFKTKIIK